MLPFRIVVGCCFAGFAAAQSVQHHVVPPAVASADGDSFAWLAGASAPLRQQHLVAASRLTGLVGRTLTALEFRRTAANEAYQGGAMALAVTVAHAPHGPLEASAAFADNLGGAGVAVFQGTVALPASPAVAGGAPSWTPENVVRIPFTTPFAYLGGPLCIDVVGAQVAGQSTDWWMADAVSDPVVGAVADLGGGCGAYGGVSKRWSSVGAHTLLPGSFAQFEAIGPAWSFGVCAFGSRAPAPIPLAWLGFNSPAGCSLMLASVDALMVAPFLPAADAALQHLGGHASLSLRVPNDPSVFGATLTTQWLEWSQQATSNAIEWTVANSAPTLGMALLEGHPQEPTGNLTTHLAHVLRFESQ
jgi:hypothetical protein